MTELDQRRGDVFEELPKIADLSCHGCLTDPPYGWSFMGAKWDKVHGHAHLEVLQGTFKGLGMDSENVRTMLWNLEWLREVHRVLVPGAYAAVFTGAKSYDLVAFAARLAGFEIQPQMIGIVGSAMAHGADVSKQIDASAGAGAEREKIGAYRSPDGTTGFKNRDSSKLYGEFKCASGEAPDITTPATPLAAAFDGHRTRYRDMLLPICVALKPVEGTYAANARKWGVGGFAIDACRVETEETLSYPSGDCPSSRVRAAYSQDEWTRNNTVRSSAPPAGTGRVPGNVLLLDEAAEAEVGRQSGEVEGSARRRRGGGHLCRTSGDRTARKDADEPKGFVDSGTAARYFPRFRYTARAAEQERLRGCEGFLWIADAKDPHGWRRVDSGEWLAADPRHRLQGTMHTTLKPLELCRWLARLIMPPPGGEAEEIRQRTTGSPGRLLIPFSGVLSEAIGAGLAGWSELVAIEREETFIEQGAARWEAWGPFEPARAEAIEVAGGMKAAPEDHRQGQLFEAVG